MTPEPQIDDAGAPVEPPAAVLDGGGPTGATPSSPSDAPPGGTEAPDVPTDPLQLLLEVQDHDLSIDRLHHRRATLPARAELLATEKALAVVDTSLLEAEGRQGELGTQQEQLEASIDAANARIRTIERQLYHGEGVAFRDQEAMVTEVKSLETRRGHLEDLELEVMEVLEPVDDEVSQLRARRATHLARAVELRESLRSVEREIDCEIAAAVAARAGVAASLPNALSAEYEKLRAKLDGVGVARLVHGSCGGCHLKLPATEFDRIRHAAPGARFHCDQCGRLLVP